MAELRAITVKQPWAWAIAHGGKTIENRSRSVAYRGPLAIHAGKGWSAEGGQSSSVREAFAPYRPSSAPARTIERAHYPGRFVAGAVIAVAELVDAHRGDDCCLPWGHVRNLAATEPHMPVYHLVLANVRPLAEPVECRGALGLWRLPPEVADLVTLATRHG